MPTLWLTASVALLIVMAVVKYQSHRIVPGCQLSERELSSNFFFSIFHIPHPSRSEGSFDNQNFESCKHWQSFAYLRNKTPVFNGSCTLHSSGTMVDQGHIFTLFHRPIEGNKGLCVLPFSTAGRCRIWWIREGTWGHLYLVSYIVYPLSSAFLPGDSAKKCIHNLSLSMWLK